MLKEVKTWEGRTVKIGDRVRYCDRIVEPGDHPKRLSDILTSHGTVVSLVSSGMVKVVWDSTGFDSGYRCAEFTANLLHLEPEVDSFRRYIIQKYQLAEPERPLEA